jgi:hypothetical protein
MFIIEETAFHGLSISSGPLSAFQMLCAASRSRFDDYLGSLSEFIALLFRVLALALAVR